MTLIDRTIVGRLVEFLRITAMLTTFNKINIDAVMLLRRTDRGLLVPVFKECDKPSRSKIESQLAELADKARKGRMSGALDNGDLRLPMRMFTSLCSRCLF